MAHRRTLRPVRPIAAILLTLAATTDTLAQGAVAAGGPAQAIALEEVVVSANRNLTATGEAVDIARISRLQIEAQQPQSVAQALKYVPNVTVEGGPRASNQTPNIRGLSTGRILQTIDGARQNFNSGHRSSYQLDPELLKQIEVKKGPASSLWGSGAIGGVVALSTKSAQDFLSDEKGLGGYLKQEYASNDNRNRTSAAIFGRTDDSSAQGFDYLLNGIVSDSDDLELGNGESLENSASQYSAWLAKAGWNLTENQRLELSLRHSDRDQLTPSNPGAVAGPSAPLIQRDSRDQNITANYWLQAFAGKHTSRLTLYRNRTGFDELRIARQERDNTKVDTRGLALVNTSAGFGGQWVYGLDAYRDQITTLRDGDNRPANLDGEVSALGVFAQLELALGQKLSLTPGLRYDHFRSENRQRSDFRQRDHAVSPSLQASYQFNDWLNLNASYGVAFRAPSAEELYTEGTHFCSPGLCNTFIPNPDLKAEEAINTEVGANVRFADLWRQNDQLSVDLAVFHNRVDNFIEQLVINPHPVFGFPLNTSYRNVDKAQIEGFELAGRYLLENLELGLSYGQSRGTNLSDNTNLNNIPADKWVLSVGHYFLQKDLKLGLKATHVSTQDQTTTQYPDPFAGYTLADVYATWEAARGSLGALKLGLSLNNLTDEHYRIAFQELSMPGRNIQFSVHYSF